MTEDELFGAYGLMSESELLEGICDALTLCGWIWTHIRRSDGVTVGHVGLPDIMAVHPIRGLAIAWELKTEKGQATPEQLEWILAYGRIPGIDARIIRPVSYDDALKVITGQERGRDHVRAWG